MESLRAKLLGVIASALPETTEVHKFIDDLEDSGFIAMLDKVMDTIVAHINEEEEVK